MIHSQVLRVMHRTAKGVAIGPGRLLFVMTLFVVAIGCDSRNAGTPSSVPNGHSESTVSIGARENGGFDAIRMAFRAPIELPGGMKALSDTSTDEEISVVLSEQRRFATENPSDLETHLLLARMARKYEGHEETASVYESARKLSSPSYAVQLELGFLAYSVGNNLDAFNYAVEVIESNVTQKAAMAHVLALLSLFRIPDSALVDDDLVEQLVAGIESSTRGISSNSFFISERTRWNRTRTK